MSRLNSKTTTLGVLKRFSVLLTVFYICAPAYAQGTASPTLEDGPFANSENQALSGASLIGSKSIYSIFSNPAEIGGPADAPPRKHSVRELHFPKISNSYNGSGKSFYSGLGVNNFNNKTIIRNASTKVVDNESDLFARTSFGLGMTLGRVSFGSFYDNQVAAIKKQQDPTSSDIKFRDQNTTFAGLSFADPRGNLSLGISIALMQRSEYNNTLTPSSFADDAAWNSALSKSAFQDSSAQAINAGFTWRFMNIAKPYISASITDLGDTQFKKSNDNSVSATQPETYHFNLGLKPRLSPVMSLHIATTMDYKSTASNSFENQYGLGTELSMFRRTPIDDYLKFRAGYRSSGASVGGSIDIGLINLDASSYPVKLGTDNNAPTERRTSISIGIDVADPFK